jgi:hypothetical protein
MELKRIELAGFEPVEVNAQDDQYVILKYMDNVLSVNVDSWDALPGGTDQDKANTVLYSWVATLRLLFPTSKDFPIESLNEILCNNLEFDDDEAEDDTNEEDADESALQDA